MLLLKYCLFVTEMIWFKTVHDLFSREIWTEVSNLTQAGN